MLQNTMRYTRYLAIDISECVAHESLKIEKVLLCEKDNGMSVAFGQIAEGTSIHRLKKYINGSKLPFQFYLLFRFFRLPPKSVVQVHHFHFVHIFTRIFLLETEKGTK